MVNKLQKVLYTAHAKSTGGRDGKSVAEDGHLDVKLDPPPAMGGKGEGTNPESLFAAGYSACFIGAIKAVARSQKLTVPPDITIDAAVGIGPIEPGFGIQAELKIHIPGMEKDAAEKLVEAAHQVCPYSNATRGNIEVTLTVV